MADKLPFAAARDGVRLAVRVTPKASVDGITGVALDADGEAALKVSVNAPPEDGKANAALIKILARQFRLRQSDFAVVLGATQRRKLVHIAGDPATLLAAIEEGLRPWLKHA